MRLRQAIICLVLLCNGPPALAQDSRVPNTTTIPADTTSIDATKLARAAHAKAAAIDRLPRFLIRTSNATLADVVLDDPAEDATDNLKRLLDLPMSDGNWFRFGDGFAWDENHFVIGFLVSPGKPDQPDHPFGPPLVGTCWWGSRTLSGQTTRGSETPPLQVLQSDVAAIWKRRTISSPNYLLATYHRFWWGDNNHHNQRFSGAGVPPAFATYRSLGIEDFDGESCHVVLSPARRECLWISRSTGLIRGVADMCASTNPTRPTNRPQQEFFQTEVVKQIAGREFASQQEYVRWHHDELQAQPSEKQWDLSLAWTEYNKDEFEHARPGLLVRFRDFREVAPGLWWPFAEDRVQGMGGKTYMRGTVRVELLRTDFDLADTVRSLHPKEGEQVQDQRLITPVK